jgi:hypothetical protein
MKRHQMLTVKTKKWVRSIGSLATPLLVLVALASAAQADSLVLKRVDGTSSGDGGEFNLEPVDGLAMDFVGGPEALTDVSFQSFCLEHNEYVGIDPAGITYRYEISEGAKLGGVAGQTLQYPEYDPIDPFTAWLYASFIEGSLTGYDYTVGAPRDASAKALQNAIWYSENEIGHKGNPDYEVAVDLSGQALSFYNAAVLAEPQSIGNVRVLNLYYGTGADSYRQDQLIMFPSVPTPSAILIGLPLLGLIGAFRVIRRRRR